LLRLGLVGGLLVAGVLAVVTACTTAPDRRELAGEYLNLGNAYFDLGEDADLERAAELYARAIALDPTLARATYNLARAYVELGHFDQGIEKLNELLAEDEDNTYLLSTRAYAYERSERREQAIADYERVLEINEYDADAWFNLGLLYWRDDNPAKATEPVVTAHDIEPDASSALLLARIKRKLEETEDAIAYLEEAMELGVAERDEFDAHALAGRLYRDAEQYGQARTHYEDALELDPDAADVRFELATVLLRDIEEQEEGTAELRRALDDGFAEEDELTRLVSSLGGELRELIEALLQDEGWEIDAEGTVRESEDAPEEEAPDEEVPENDVGDNDPDGKDPDRG